MVVIFFELLILSASLFPQAQGTSLYHQACLDSLVYSGRHISNIPTRVVLARTGSLLQ